MNKPSPVIVAVDDNVVTLKLIQQAIKPINVNYVGIHNVKDAIPFIKYNKPDLLFVDLVLPKISGFDLIEEIRGDCTLMFLPVVVISPYNRIQDRQTAKQLGVKHFLVKPLTTRDVYGVCVDILR